MLAFDPLSLSLPGSPNRSRFVSCSWVPSPGDDSSLNPEQILSLQIKIFLVGTGFRFRTSVAALGVPRSWTVCLHTFITLSTPMIRWQNIINKKTKKKTKKWQADLHYCNFLHDHVDSHGGKNSNTDNGILQVSDILPDQSQIPSQSRFFGKMNALRLCVLSSLWRWLFGLLSK
jgi:hypothetical protein